MTKKKRIPLTLNRKGEGEERRERGDCKERGEEGEGKRKSSFILSMKE